MLQNIILERKIEFNEKELEFINFIKTSYFPFFYQRTTGEKYYAYVHTFMNRIKSSVPERGIINSEFYNNVENIFLRVCNDNNIGVKTILRAALNSSFYESELYGDIHIDHDFPHYNFLMYLNDFDFGYTYLFDKNDKLTNIIYPEINKVVVFNGCRHAQGFCRPGQRRLVLAITFEVY